MKDYQPKKNNPYRIPHNQYMQTLYFIRSYYELKEQYNDILNESHSPQTDGQPHGTGIGDPTAQKAQRLEQLHDDIKIIEDGLNAIPEEHRKVVWENVVNRIPLNQLGYYAEITYKRWRQCFIWYVADKKKIF